MNGTGFVPGWLKIGARGTMLTIMDLLQKLAVVLFGFLVMGSSAMAGTAKSDDVAQGRDLYLQYCASCHGRNADGKGPMAPALSTPPANLRLLWERYGNPLPEDQVARFIDGRADVKAHGPRDMPVWGKGLAEPEGNRASSQRTNRQTGCLPTINTKDHADCISAVMAEIRSHLAQRRHGPPAMRTARWLRAKQC